MKKIWEFLKPILLFILKVIGWLALFVIIMTITSYDESRIPFALVCGIYFMIVVNYYSSKNTYKSWVQMAEYNEFYKYFCESYKNNFSIGLIVAFSLGVAFCNTMWFICLIAFTSLYDLWDRRYLTNDIKQDMILEKLKSLSNP